MKKIFLLLLVLTIFNISFSESMIKRDARSTFYDDTLTGLGDTVQEALDNVSGGGSSTEVQEAVGTSIVFGGELSINVDTTKFDIQAGKGFIVDNYTDPENPVVTEVTWPTQTAITVPNIGTQALTFISIDVNGDVIPSPDALNSGEKKEFIEIGTLVHPNLTNIESTINFGIWGKDTAHTTDDLIDSLGSRLNRTGNKYSPNGTNLRIDKSLGLVFGNNINYKNDKKSPNILESAAQTEINFFELDANTIFGQSQDIDVTQYDPDGLGTLAPIPAGMFVVHRIYFDPATNFTIVQYGQYVYDSLKKAITTYDKEEYIRNPSVDGVPIRGAIAVQQGATDISNRLQAKIVNFGLLGAENFGTIETFSKFAEIVELGDALSYERQEFSVVESAGDLFVDVQAIGGGDITYIFNQQEYELDCTTGSGVGGAARIQIVEGSASTSLQENWIYAIPQTDGTMLLQNSTTKPAQSLEFSPICKVVVPDSDTFLANGVWLSQRYTESKEHDGKSIIHYIQDKLRAIGSTYLSGVQPTATINTGPSPDQVDFEVTSGIIKQIRDQTFPALDIGLDGIYVANASGLGVLTQNQKLGNLALALEDTQGNSLAGNEYNLVIFGTINHTSAECKLWVNLPNDSYTGGFFSPDAYNDSEQTAVVSVPDELRATAFLIARVPLEANGAGTEFNFINPAGKPEIISLLGNPIGLSGSGASGSAVTFNDDQFAVFNLADNTKRIEFDASSITTNNTRTYTYPDFDGVLALTNIDNEFTTNQKITGFLNSLRTDNASGSSQTHLLMQRGDGTGNAASIDSIGGGANDAVGMRIVTDNQERLRIDGSGNLGNGTTLPQARLHNYIGDAGSDPVWDTGKDAIIVEGDDNTAVQIFTPNTQSGIIGFSDPEVRNQGLLSFNHATNAMRLSTNIGNVPSSIYIDSSQNVGIGVTGDNPTAKLHIGGVSGVDGIRFPDGTLQTTAAVGGVSKYDATVGATGADYTTLKAAIDAGKTKILVIDNTTETADITMPSNLLVEGLSREQVNVNMGIYKFLDNSGANLSFEFRNLKITFAYTLAGNLFSPSSNNSGKFVFENMYFDNNSTASQCRVFSNSRNECYNFANDIILDLPNFNQCGWDSREGNLSNFYIVGGGTGCGDVLELSFSNAESIILSGTYSTSLNTLDIVQSNVSGILERGTTIGRIGATLAKVSNAEISTTNFYVDGDNNSFSNINCSSVTIPSGSDSNNVVNLRTTGTVTISGDNNKINNSSINILNSGSGSSGNAFSNIQVAAGIDVYNCLISNITIEGTSSFQIRGDKSIIRGIHGEDSSMTVRSDNNNISDVVCNAITIITGADNNNLNNTQTDVAIIDSGTGNNKTNAIVF